MPRLKGFEELVDSGPKPSLRRRLKNFTVVATPARRRIYSAGRRMLIFRELQARRQIAAQNTHHAGVHLDRDRGFEVIPPGRFAEAQDVVREATDLVSAFNPEKNWDQAPRNVGDYSIGLLNPREIPPDSIYLRFILRPDIIASAAHYLGVVPVLSSAQIWYSRFDGKEATRGRLFHFDPEDIAAVRVFVYCTDLDVTGGPFVVMDARNSDVIQRKIGYKCGGTFLPVADERITSLIGPNALSNVAGKAGTVVFADTCRCFHYGSRVQQGGSRIFAAFTLLSPAALVLPVNYRQALPLVHLATPDRPLLERLVLGASALG